MTKLMLHFTQNFSLFIANWFLLMIVLIAITLAVKEQHPGEFAVLVMFATFGVIGCFGITTLLIFGPW